MARKVFISFLGTGSANRGYAACSPYPFEKIRAQVEQGISNSDVEGRATLYASQKLINEINVETNPPLTLPEVKKRVEKLGYKGLKKYLYISFVEFPKMMFQSVEYFARSHENKLEVEFQQRFKAANFIKTISIVAGFAAFAALIFFNPFFISTGITFIVYLLISFASLFSTNVIAHSAYLYVSKKSEGNLEKYIKLTELFNKHKTMPKGKSIIELDKDIDAFLSDAKTIRDIILKPKKHPLGKELREVYIKSLELFYTLSCEEYEHSARDKIFDFLYEGGFYAKIDSFVLQNAIVGHFRSRNNMYDDRAKQIFSVLEMLSDINFAKIRKINSAENINDEKVDGDVRDLIAVQNKIIFLLVGFGGVLHSPDSTLWRENEGIIAKQMFLKQYMNMRRRVNVDTVDALIDEETKNNFLKVLSKNDRLEVLSYITKENLPYQLGCYLISVCSPEIVYSILKSEEIDIRFRLYALKTLSQHNLPEKVLMHYINGKMNKFKLSSVLGKDSESFINEISEVLRQEKFERILDDKTNETFVNSVKEVIEETASSKSNNPHIRNIDSEVLYIAIIIALNADPSLNIDVAASLRNMPSFMSLNGKKDIKYLKDDFSGNPIVLQDMNIQNRKQFVDKLIDAMYKNNLIKYKNGSTAAQTT
jgi:predicted nucleic acid-binding protein